ncbi:uncharacterized protein LOC118425836 [Branchiostoma floridae]|uniref:Uncharacterized protein LOC118425836 n=1 Tax=Branchiostoma floridae TaxID=7739 RepID=C3XVP2_BRAFL|nr:uncharacterized protein LOC118425836 [Branchiostoma floridae]|eukprot:XP_002611826.1 hypothetical protein BRAFLDRAFT_123369 [Branchiostoma floridae]
MEERDVELLRDHQRDIVNNLRVRDIKSYLIEKKVFNSDMFEEIQMEPTRRQQAEKFLDLLVLRGPDAFGHFCDALKIDYNFLFEKLTTDQKKTPDQSSLKEENKRLKNDNVSKGRKLAEVSKVLSFLYQTLENIEKELSEGVSYDDVIKLVKKGMRKLHKHLPLSRLQNRRSPKEKTVSAPNIQPDKSKDTTTNVNDKIMTKPQQTKSSTSTLLSSSETTERTLSQHYTKQDAKKREGCDDLSTISSSTASQPSSEENSGMSKVPYQQSFEGLIRDKLPTKSEKESNLPPAPIIWKARQQVSKTGTSQTKEPKDYTEAKHKQERTGFTNSLFTSESQGTSNTVNPYRGRRHSLQRTQIQPFGQIRVSGFKTSGGVVNNTSSYPAHAFQPIQVQAWKTRSREDARKEDQPTLAQKRNLQKSQSLPKL